MALVLGRRRSPVFYFNLWGFVFALPALILLLVFNIYPLINAFYISLTSWDLGPRMRFVGLANFIYMFTSDQNFLRSIGTTLYYVVGLNPLMWTVSLGLALLFNRQFVGRSAFRTIYFTPVVISWVVAALVWFIILGHPTYSLSARILGLFGRPGFSFIHSAAWVMPAMIFLSLWKGVGYYMVLFLAGLQNIPQELYEAAAVDGANAWQRFWYITIPLLRPALLFVMVISIIGSFQVFTPIWILTQGGPAGASRVLTVYMYENAFMYLKMGYAAAMSVVLFLILGFLTLVQFRLVRSDIAE